MNNKQLERWSPWLLLVVVLVLWQIVCSAFGVSDFIFPSPWRIWTQFWEFKEIIAGHAWRTFWVTMAGFGIAIVVGVLLGFVIGVGVLEECAKVLPVWWIYVHKKNVDNLSTIVFLGCVSGFAFGVAEAVNYSISYALGLSAGGMGFGGYLIAQLTRLITLPLLHAVWSGIFAYFVALASVNRHVGNGLLLAGLVITASLHGLYDTFSGSLIGVAIAVVSILVFIAYYRSGENLQAKISGLARAQSA